MKNLKIKIVTGYRQEQSYTISAEEAHKAYYLFLNPDKRGVFENGVALRGQDIHSIEPDYHATMGWNPGYNLGADDYAEIKKSGIDRQIREVLSLAKGVAQNELLEKMNIPLSHVLTPALQLN